MESFCERFLTKEFCISQKEYFMSVDGRLNEIIREDVPNFMEMIWEKILKPIFHDIPWETFSCKD